MHRVNLLYRQVVQKHLLDLCLIVYGLRIQGHKLAVTGSIFQLYSSGQDPDVLNK